MLFNILDMDNLILFNPEQASENVQKQLLESAKNYALQAELGFVGQEKFWCKQAYGSMILEALSSPFWLGNELENSLFNIYQTIDFN